MLHYHGCKNFAFFKVVRLFFLHESEFCFAFGYRSLCFRLDVSYAVRFCARILNFKCWHSPFRVPPVVPAVPDFIPPCVRVDEGKQIMVELLHHQDARILRCSKLLDYSLYTKQIVLVQCDLRWDEWTWMERTRNWTTCKCKHRLRDTRTSLINYTITFRK